MARRTPPSQPRPRGGAGTSNMTRVCAGCKEPSEHCEKVREVWLCTSCVIKLKDRVRALRRGQSTSPDTSTVKHLMRSNGTDEKRHGADEIYQGAENDDTWLSEEPIP